MGPDMNFAVVVVIEHSHDTDYDTDYDNEQMPWRYRRTER